MRAVKTEKQTMKAMPAFGLRGDAETLRELREHFLRAQRGCLSPKRFLIFTDDVVRNPDFIGGNALLITRE